MKNKYGGILLIVVGRNPNHQYFPIAFGVVENVTKDSWSSFIKFLLEDIRENKWTFIYGSKKVNFKLMSYFVYLNCYGLILNKRVYFVAKGLFQVFEEEYPGFEHIFCLRHLYANFKKMFGGVTLFRDLMMVATKTTYFEAHEYKMLQIKEVSSEAYE